MKKLALLGAARTSYEDEVNEILKTHDYCWTGWTYRISESKQKILKQQFEKDGYFHIYYHDIKTPEDASRGEGTGFIEYRLIVERTENKKTYYYDDEPFPTPESKYTSSRDRGKEHRLYACIFKKPIKIPSKKWSTFIDYDTDVALSHFKLNIPDVYFEYIIDPFVK